MFQVFNLWYLKPQIVSRTAPIFMFFLCGVTLFYHSVEFLILKNSKTEYCCNFVYHHKRSLLWLHLSFFYLICCNFSLMYYFFFLRPKICEYIHLWAWVTHCEKHSSIQPEWCWHRSVFPGLRVLLMQVLLFFLLPLNSEIFVLKKCWFLRKRYSQEWQLRTWAAQWAFPPCYCIYQRSDVKC